MSEDRDDLLSILKCKVIESIENERDEMYEKYEESIENVNNSESPQLLLLEIQNISGNPIEKRNLMKNILTEELKSDFFKKTTPEIKMNYICFSNRHYSVCFPTYRSKFITVSIICKHKSSSGTEEEPELKISKSSIELIELWESSKGINNQIVNLYSKIMRGVYSDRLFAMKVKVTGEIDKYVLSRKKKIEKFKAEHKAWLSKMSLHEENKESFLSFLDEILDDLVRFTNSGWLTHFENVNQNFIEDIETLERKR